MQSFAQIREQSDWSLPVRDTDTFDQDDGGRSALDGGNMVFFSSQPSSVVSAPVEVNADTDDEDDECKTLTRLAKQEQLTFPRRGIDDSEELRSLERLKKSFCRKEKDDEDDDLSDFARSDDEDASGDMSDFARSDMSGTDDDLSDFKRDDDNDADADADDYTFLLMSY